MCAFASKAAEQQKQALLPGARGLTLGFFLPSCNTYFSEASHGSAGENAGARELGRSPQPSGNDWFPGNQEMALDEQTNQAMCGAQGTAGA